MATNLGDPPVRTLAAQGVHEEPQIGLGRREPMVGDPAVEVSRLVSDGRGGIQDDSPSRTLQCPGVLSQGRARYVYSEFVL